MGQDGGEELAGTWGKRRQGRFLFEMIAQRGQLDGGAHAVATDIVVGMSFLDR